MQLRSLSLETRERPWLPTKRRMRKEPTSRLLTDYFYTHPFLPLFFFFFQVPVDTGEVFESCTVTEGCRSGTSVPCSLLESFVLFIFRVFCIFLHNCIFHLKYLILILYLILVTLTPISCFKFYQIFHLQFYLISFYLFSISSF